MRSNHCGGNCAVLQAIKLFTRFVPWNNWRAARSPGIGVGILAALAAGRLLVHLVDGMGTTEPSTFAIMIPILVAAALFASFLPARRASRIDPMSALRQE